MGIALVIGAAQGGSNPLRPLTVSSSSSDSSTPQATLAFQQVDELSALETALSEAASAQQPAFVNFTADWCISCKLMERDVFPDPNVVAALNDFRLIEVDVTDTDAQSRELLNRFNLFGPPSLLFFSQGEEVRDARIQGEITAPQLVQHLEALRRWQQG